MVGFGEMKKYSIVILALIFLPFTISGCKNSIFKKNTKEHIKVAENHTAPPAAEPKPGAAPEPSPAPTPEPRQPEPAPQEPSNNPAIQIGDESISFEKYDAGYKNYLIDHSLMDNDESKRKYSDEVTKDLLFFYYAKRSKLVDQPDFKEKSDKLYRQFTIDYVKNNIILGQVQVSNLEIEEYYKQHITNYTEPEKIQVRHILTNTEEEANIAMKRLKNGEDFRKVASEISIHSSRNKGGELPPFSKGTYNIAFEEAAFKLKIGELSPIIKAETGYHIIEKTGEYPSQVIALEQIKGDISRTLLEQKEKDAIEQFIDNLRKEVTINIFKEPEENKKQ